MKYLITIFFILFSFNLVYSSEINNNICPVIDLKDDILKTFFIERKEETYTNFFTGTNVTNIKYYYDIDFNNKKQVDIIYNLVKYYDNTINYLYNINCFDYNIKFLVEHKSIIFYPNYSKIDKSSLMNSLSLFYNTLNNYNFSITDVKKNVLSIYDDKPVCKTVECFKIFTTYKKLYN